jgi:uncharacterized protein (DUF1800 family)
MPNQSDIEHLLRRTEFIARPDRVAELVPKSLEAAVDDILAVPGNPGTVNATNPTEWTRGEQLTYFWFDRMAHDSPRPCQEKMAFFWHGHFCSSMKKVELYEPMREQIDTFRFDGLGNLRALASKVSTQVAMLRYLDNNQNFKSSPNENFARELMELFLLGVGNYTEADVQASARAWTGHTDVWATGQYIWRGDLHDGSPQQFLGRPINTDPDPTRHGVETIGVILGGAATVPVGVNAGRKTQVIAAEFISRKMWKFFAGTTAPAAVIDAMSAAAVNTNFNITPWLRTMLLRSEFYTTEVKQGLVRSPVDLMVAYLYATGLRSTGIAPLWWLEGMGQRPLVPPDVSGWKHNAYFVNASAMGQRALAARFFMWNTMLGFWAGDGLIHLGGGTISRAEAEAYDGQPEQFVDLLLARMRFTPTQTSRDVLYAHARASRWWERISMVSLVLMLPEMNVA